LIEVLLYYGVKYLVELCDGISSEGYIKNLLGKWVQEGKLGMVGHGAETKYRIG
jgi:hypothetical protein